MLRDRLLVFYMEQIDRGDLASHLVEMVQHDPDPGALALHLADGTEGEDNGRGIALAAALEKAPLRADLLRGLAKASSSHALRAASYVSALRRIRLSGSQADPEREAALAGNWLATLLEAGLAESALDAFDRLSAEIRSAILDGRASPLDNPFGFLPSDASPEVLLRSLCVAGSLGQQDADEVGWGVDHDRKRAAPLDADLCVSLGDDPYTERMVAPSGDDPFPLIQEVGYFAGVTSGRVAPTVWLRALIDWLMREKYPEAARDWYPLLLAQLESDLRDEPPALILELLPSDVRGDYDQVRQEIQDLRDEVRRHDEEIKRTVRNGARTMVSLLAGPSPAPADLAAELISNSLGRARIFHLDARPVPPGFDIDQETLGDLLIRREELWRSLYRFPESFWPCQVQQADTNVAAAGWHAATGFDHSPYGPRYVLIRSDDAGSTWSGPLETGLPAGPDLQVYPAALLPPVSEGALQLEVLVRGGRPDGNAQPGIALLSLPLAILERDGDGDGLTDVLEERLMTDPKSPDTDRDGLDDAEDPLPLIPLAPTDEPSELETLLADLVPHVCDTVPSTFLDTRMPRETWTRTPKEDRGRLERTCGLVFDRAAFRSMMPGKRLLIVTSEEAERARLKFGDFEPVSFDTFFMDRGRNRAFLKWTRGWVEHRALIVRSKGGWRVEPQ